MKYLLLVMYFSQLYLLLATAAEAMIAITIIQKKPLKQKVSAAQWIKKTKKQKMKVNAAQWIKQAKKSN